ncbi:MAG: RNA polymerase factor sigma-54, partial [Phaeodactylibacter sp.]|nr:RNA polymerase factor sigma-54 [Phaeodactylibacter sp.]
QQIQLMKLLQVPTVMLEQRIKEELEANPALEEGAEREDNLSNEEGENDLREDEFGEETTREEEFELDDYLNDYMDEDPTIYGRGEGSYAEEDEKEMPISVQDTFHEHLERQVGLLDFDDPIQETIALQIIGSIDEDGYLRREPESIVDDLMFGQGIQVSMQQVEAVLRMIQQFDPPGTGARDLQECLSIQLGQELKRDDLGIGPLMSIDLAKQIIDEHFDIFSKKHFTKIQSQLDITEEDLRDAIQEILKLNPKPSSGFASTGSRGVQYVVPDFIIINRDGELELSLNSRNAPDLRVNDQYRDMLRTYKANSKGKGNNKKQKEAVLFIKQKIDSAKWFIDAIRQRQNTMYKTMYAILQYQYDFFLTGDQTKLRPMILKDIADITGLDISTISRVANSKFVQTEFGTKRLKDFFSEGMQTGDGEEVSTLEVKKILSDVIEVENKRKPLSDEKLKDILQEKGYNIARRTVAKYREQMNIPVARLRKEL